MHNYCHHLFVNAAKEIFFESKCLSPVVVNDKIKRGWPSIDMVKRHFNCDNSQFSQLHALDHYPNKELVNLDII